ncbi:hypothetical protein EP47_01795 [Legionella norrlandica]|uniref:Uncharacterized protein n=1 Tax=Legionella norrlandica TaxID=1498499 RepID=A0A0A2SRI8_9GAMM|nr:hypothetical protein [Legionella norrlandica]KGP62326.1 hypothetical protein EP47_01795 [Legionella norrlandica]
MSFFKKENLVPDSPLIKNENSISLSVGDEVIDKDGNNAIISEMFEWDTKDYDEEKGDYVALDMTGKVKLKYDSGFTKIVDSSGISKGISDEKKDTKDILETIYGIDTHDMSQERINSLYTVLILYADFYKKNHVNSHRYQRIYDREKREYSKEFDINLYCFNSILANLKIELPASKIKEIYEQFGVIQLREINKKSLILGCGSEPLIYGASTKGYKEEHAHQNQITMSPELNFNPTLVAYFQGSFKFESNFFNEIVFEGFFRRAIPDIIDDLNEVNRILAPEGKVSFTNDKLKKTYDKEQIDTIIRHYQEHEKFDVFRSDLSLEIGGHPKGFVS